jgi:hypothetical protein
MDGLICGIVGYVNLLKSTGYLRLNRAADGSYGEMVLRYRY